VEDHESADADDEPEDVPADLHRVSFRDARLGE
jgi:hypothetical protein